ncbi:hypothetical protein OQG70_08265 [Streptococcus macedonicus]|uniref:hypothetical protein n=1 Tax=Streptococcus macedonicus TaxID=59310 RepID=UPI0022434F4E|nr:hypothetical protein [Streptococcus macedonicus]MCW8645216.1 hypothetical protein [Streptococcus macedonicus]
MKITNKSELFKAAWKMFKANKITFSEALKYAWNIYKTYLKNEINKTVEVSAEDKELGKAMTWARIKVAQTPVNWDFDAWKKFANEHKAEASIWKLAAKYARIQDSELRSFY